MTENKFNVSVSAPILAYCTQLLAVISFKHNFLPPYSKNLVNILYKNNNPAIIRLAFHRNPKTVLNANVAIIAKTAAAISKNIIALVEISKKN